MENTPALEGGTISVENGPESLPKTEGREAPFSPSRPETGRLGEELATHLPKPPSKAKEEAETAGVIAARQIPSVGATQPEASQRQPNLPATPTSRKIDPFNRAGLTLAAARAAQLKQQEVQEQK